MDLVLKDYELSIWKDYVIEQQEVDPITQETVTVKYLQEKKVVVIASNNMDTLAQARNIKLNLNVNGTQKLTFDLYTNYIDFTEPERGEIKNPFIDLLANETKIKLLYDNTWYDFIIKNITENTDNNMISFEATDIFIEELSKNGFDLEFATEIENNQGTAAYLVNKILEGSEWLLDEDHSDKIKATVSEPLLNRRTTTQIIGTNMENNTSVTIPSGATIYEFYSFSSSRYIGDIQVIYPTGTIVLDEENNIVNFPNILISASQAQYIASLDDNINYRGKRLVRQQITNYDAALGRYVKEYIKNSDNKHYKVDTKMIVHSPTLVTNYIDNNSDFESNLGWYPVENIDKYYYPQITASTVISQLSNLKRFLKTSIASSTFYNNAFTVNKSKILSADENARKLVVRLKYKTDSSGSYITSGTICVPSIKYYTYGINGYTPGNAVYTPSASSHTGDYIYWIFTLNSDKTIQDIYDNQVGLFFTTTQVVYIEEAAMFLYAEDNNGNIIFPETAVSIETVTYDAENRVYDPDENTQATTEDEFIFKEIISNQILAQNYLPAYSSNLEKITSISAKESNRFNLLQDVCEAFGCWIRIDVHHNANGTIATDNITGRKLKNIIIQADAGQFNYAGFRYGVNLKKIQRNLVSDEIVTKTIVQPNSNQFAESGFCTIQRASLNKLGQNLIYNFDYYINKNVLDRAFVENRLQYLQIAIDSHNRQNLINEGQLETYTNTLMHAESDYTYKKAKYDAAYELRESAKQGIKDYCGITYNGSSSSTLEQIFGNWYIQDYTSGNKLTDFITAYHQNNKIVSELSSEIATLETEIAEYKSVIQDLKDNIQIDTEAIENLLDNFDFQFIQYIKEGTWKDDGYVDDNLYYLDALKVSHASAFPKVTYTIDVIELSALDEYKGYNYKIGDRTYIEDIHFFGYKSDGITPFHKDVIISECTYCLDSPMDNTIKVQTYSTQFEDLFQRQTAAVQQLSMAQGSYNNIANILNDDGTLNKDVIQNTLSSNSFVFSNPHSSSVIWSDDGLRTYSNANLSQSIKFVDEGVFATTDGGDTWRNIANGSGLDPSSLRIGNLYTDTVTLFDRDNVNFRWDKLGLTAFLPNYLLDPVTETYDVSSYNYDKFVRFNSLGIYGYSPVDWTQIPQTQPNIVKINDIWKNAAFSLTWRGLSINGAGGSLKLDTENGIRIINALDPSGSFGGTNGFKIEKLYPTYTDSGSYNEHDKVYKEETIQEYRSIAGQLVWYTPIPAFDTSINYQTGDKVRNNSKVYVAPTNISAGEWNESQWLHQPDPQTETVFQADAFGNLRLAGAITSGNRTTLTDNEEGVYLGTAGLAIQKTFENATGNRVIIAPQDSATAAIFSIERSVTGEWNKLFYIDSDGTLHINNAEITGSLTGTITTDSNKAEKLSYLKSQGGTSTELTIYPQPGSSEGQTVVATVEVIHASISNRVANKNNYQFVIHTNCMMSVQSTVAVTFNRYSNTSHSGNPVASQTIQNIIYPAGVTSQSYTIVEVDYSGSEQSMGNGDLNYISAVVTGSFNPAVAQDAYIVNTNFMPETNNSFSLGSQDKSWSAVYVTNGVVTSSDIRTKENINQISDIYSQLFDKLYPCQYNYIGKKEERFGFIAQDVLQAMRDLGLSQKDFAAVCGDEQMYGINYSEFIALCVNEIQKLKAEIKELKEKI